MPRKFRLTCARTTYFDIDLAAEDEAHAERLLAAALAADPACAGAQPCGKPVHRVVEIVAQEEAAPGLHDEAA